MIELRDEKPAVRIRQDDVEDDKRYIGRRKRISCAGSRCNAPDLDPRCGQGGPDELSCLRIVIDNENRCRIGARSLLVGQARPYRFESKMLRSQLSSFVQIIP